MSSIFIQKGDIWNHWFKCLYLHVVLFMQDIVVCILNILIMHTCTQELYLWADF